MGLIWTFSTVSKPLLNWTITVPGVITGKCLDGQHVWIIKDLVFLRQYGKGLTCRLVFVDLVIFVRKESRFLNHIFVNFNNICMASR